MNENLKKFLELVSKDEALKEKVVAHKDMKKEDLICTSIALAKELGIELTEADFAVKEADHELADDELDAVVGGNKLSDYFGLDCNCSQSGYGDGCYCIDPGLGQMNDLEGGHIYQCTCKAGGQGGDDNWNNATYCYCPSIGSGSL